MKPFKNISNIFINYTDQQYSELFSMNAVSRGFHTDVIDDLIIKMHPRGIALISTDSNVIDYIGIVKKSGKVASKKSRIRIEYIKKFDLPIDISNVFSDTNTIFSSFTKDTNNHSITLIPYQVWNNILSKIKEDENNFLKVKNAFQKFEVKTINEDDRIEENNGFQKDSLALILRCAGFDSQSIGLSEYDIRNDSMPDFLRNLKELKIREDLMIINDSSVFDKWKIVDKNIVCTTLSDGRKKLSIMYSNRLKLEEALGVDLIYIDDQNRSIVLVQYKRLVGDNFKQYNPNNDKSFAKELRSMEIMMSILNSKNSGKYRFNSNPFYFKFCKDIQSVQTRELVDGMYMPLDYLKHLMNTFPEHGKKKFVISYESVSNYFNNTLFTGLMKSGLIGCSEYDYDLIGEIINEIINNGNSIILGKLENLTIAST